MRSDSEIPQPYRRLLVHTHHMTVTVEEFYQQTVDVKVLECQQHGNDYARKILLTLQGSGRVVQFGIVRIDLSVLTDPVRQEIEAGRTPLGRVLIEHGVLRTVQPVGYFEAILSSAMLHRFGLSEPRITYGRIGVISTDGHPAIQVAEILAPIEMI